MRLAATSAMIVVTLAGGCAGEEVGVQRAAVNGDLDDGTYPGVLGMFINKPSGVARCTGALIAPNLVITARHCVAPTSGGFVDCGRSPLGPAVEGSEALSTTLGTMPPDDRSVYVAGARIEVPVEGDDECGFDIAAVFLERNLDPSEATPYPPRLDTAAAVGERVTAIGFGSDGSGGGLGVRRVRGGLEVVCVGADECGGPFVQDTELLVGDDVFCQFDSGAPALDADGRLIGTVSRGMNPCDAPILSATYAWSDWIRGLGRDAAAAGDYATPSWAEAPASGDAGTDGGPGGDGGDGGEGDASIADGGEDAAPPGDDGGGCRAAGDALTHEPLLLSLFALFFFRRRRRG